MRGLIASPEHRVGDIRGKLRNEVTKQPMPEGPLYLQGANAARLVRLEDTHHGS